MAVKNLGEGDRSIRFQSSMRLLAGRIDKKELREKEMERKREGSEGECDLILAEDTSFSTLSAS
jgi:hypothetical protein